MNAHDGTENHGRKGIAYDWQSLYVTAQTANLDHELTRLTPELVD